MQLKTILNQVQKHRCFIYGAVSLSEKDKAIEIDIRPRANSRLLCSVCGRPGPGYDTLKPRRFEFVPVWGFSVFFVYAMRRVDCSRCGVRVESVPWATGKHRLTDTYAWFLARWAKRMSWKEVAEVFRTSWEQVFRSVQMAVEWGRQHMDLNGITAIGVDEIQWQRGHRYLTLVYQIDEVRAKEARALTAKGFEPVLKGSRWLVLKRPINLTDKQEVRLAELLQYNLRTVRSYLLKEDFQFFWGYISPHWAGRFLDRWCTRVMRSRIEPMKKVAKTLRRHRMLILNWFRAKGTISAAAVEGFNNKAKLTTRKAFGFRTFKAVEVALFHTLGDLPEPTGTHRFC